MRLIFRFRRWLGDAFRKPLLGSVVEDVPDEIDPCTVYLVGEDGQAWSVALQCPCGCEQLIQLSLLRNDSPRWKAFHHDDGTVTLEPSVWRTRGCKSHFNVRRGRVIWAREAASRDQKRPRR